MVRKSGSADIASTPVGRQRRAGLQQIARLEEGILGYLADVLNKNAENI
jgi:hypothetical protein